MISTAIRISALLIFTLLAGPLAIGQTANAIPAALAASDTVPSTDGIALSPARFELEMLPGSEKTVVVNLDYRSQQESAKPSRILASLNDWDITPAGDLKFYKIGTIKNSSSSWIVYTPSEVTVMPGRTHSIRVTIAVPKDAEPGDHTSALIVEQRPDAIKLRQNERQMVVRYRMAAVFYIKVPGLTRRGSLQNLKATATENEIIVTPTLRNEGNSVIRPVSSIEITDSAGRTIAGIPEGESLPILRDSEVSRSLLIEKNLTPGSYTVKYKIDFQNGDKTIEGVTDLIIPIKR